MSTRLCLDANVVLRFLTGEPPALAERARALMQRAEQGDLRLYLSPLVLAEVFWVLKSFYRQSQDRISETLIALISAAGIEVDHRDRSIEALELVREKNVDYLDAVLAVNASADGGTVCTFDEKHFKRLSVEWLPPPTP